MIFNTFAFVVAVTVTSHKNYTPTTHILSDNTILGLKISRDNHRFDHCREQFVESCIDDESFLFQTVHHGARR